MKATDTLSHATLADSLNAACYAITGAYIEGTEIIGRIPGVISSGRFDEFIPGLVFDFAVKAGWLPPPFEPEEGDGIILGSFYVEEQYREWFIGLIDVSLSKLREVAEKTYDDDNASEDAQQIITDLVQLVLGRSLAYTLKKRGHRTQSVATQSQSEAPSEGKPTPLPEWAEAFKAAIVPETSPAERKALEEKFLATHRHPVYGDAYEKQELQWMAVANRKQWERWRRGEIANNSVPGKRILDLLERNEPARSPGKLPRRNREKLRVK